MGLPWSQLLGVVACLGGMVGLWVDGTERRRDAVLAFRVGAQLEDEGAPARLGELLVESRLAGLRRGQREGSLSERSDELVREARRLAETVAPIFVAEERTRRADRSSSFGDEVLVREWGPPRARWPWILLSGAGLAAVWCGSQARARRSLDAASGALMGLAQGDDDYPDPPAATPSFRRALAEVRTAQADRRQALEAAVDEKTVALAGALEDSRTLNRRLTAVLAELESTQGRLVRQEKMAALGTLAGGVAHEFNNLLGGVRGCAEDLLEDTTDPAARETLAVIVRAARRGRTIVDGLRQFSRVPVGTREITDLSEVSRDVVRLLSSESERRGVRVELVVPTDTFRVLGASADVQQVVHNLLLNALESAPPGSTVTLELGSLDTGQVELVVRDQGPGVPGEIADRVFEPFFTTKERDGGTGLGLAVSVGIVQAFGGSLTLDGSGPGATFRLRMPAATREDL